MRACLPTLLLALATLPACTVNYYVPAGTDVAATPTPRPPRQRPRPYYGAAPQGPVAWQPAPAPAAGAPAPVRSAPPVRSVPPVRNAPPVRPPVASQPPVVAAPGPVRPTPAPPAPTPAPTAPTPAPTAPTPAPAPQPAPAPTSPGPGAPQPDLPTGGIKAPPKSLPGDVRQQPVIRPEQPVPAGAGAAQPMPADAAPAGTTKPVRNPAASGLVVLPTDVVAPTSEAPAPAPHGSPLAPDEASADETQQAPSIVFTKTPCLGTCPHYAATIYPDGRVSYEGWRYAPVAGKQEFRISVSTVNTILAQAREISFSQLEAHYTDGATDLPATTVSIRQASGPAKVVRVESAAPVELTNLLRYIEQQVLMGLGVMAGE